MRLSPLQRFILRESYQHRQLHTKRQLFQAWYKRTPSREQTADSITRSLERLIDKGLMIGFGRRTPKKWFIEEVRLTPAGRRAARKTLGVQQTLPLK